MGAHLLIAPLLHAQCLRLAAARRLAPRAIPMRGISAERERHPIAAVLSVEAVLSVAVPVRQADLAVVAVHLAEVAVGAVAPSAAAADTLPAADIHLVVVILPAAGATALEADTVVTKS